MFRVGTSDISVPAFLISSSGNVGINSFQPSAAFQITESSNDVFRVATTEFAAPAFLCDF